MNFSLTRIPKRSAELIWQNTKDGMVIVSPKAGKVRVLNQIGTSIWALLDGDHTLAEIEAILINSFGHQAEGVKIREDFYNFIEELDHRGMVTWIEN